jgi:hypothetical protein
MTVPTIIPPRLVKVVVGPAAGLGRAFSEEYMTFHVKRVKGSKPNEATITIANLSEFTIRYLEQPDQVLQLLAGEAAVGQLFAGTVISRGVVTKNDIPNRVTTIKAADGRRVWRDTTYSASYPPGTAVNVVVADLIAASGLPLGHLDPIPTLQFSAGWAYSGRWRGALAEVLLPLGYYYTIQDQALYVLNGTLIAPGNVPVITPQTGLIGSPMRTKKGVNVNVVLNPTIRPAWGLQLKSEFFDGLYRVDVCEHRGDTDGMTWQTSAQCELIQ